MAAAVRGEKKNEHVGGSPFDLAEAQAGQRKSRVPEILVGTFLVALFALGGAWFYSTSTNTVGYLALREDVNRGDVLTVEDLTVFDVSTDAPLRGLTAADRSLVVGKVALSDLKRGAIVSADQFADEAQIPPGSGVVGLDLEVGEFPTLSIRPGDRVRVVILPTSSQGQPGDAVAVVDSVEVVEVAETSGNGRMISLEMAAEDADLVAIAHAADRVRLVQVPGDGAS